MRHLLFITIGLFSFFWSGCQFFSSAESLTSDETAVESPDQLKIQKIYIQSFTGQNVKDVQEVFFETAGEQNLFTFVELLPDDYTDLKIMRLNVTDFSIWETTEKLDLNLNNRGNAPNVPGQVLRRNALVSFRVSLYEAETGKLLLRKPYSQPFQQIYVGREEIEKMPEKPLELKRLTKTLVYNLLTDFYQAKVEPLEMELEIGYGYDWISRAIYNFGNSRIKKGNRFADIGEYDKAIWLWQLVLFEPEDDEPLDIYKKNRASAYYNLGVVYHKLGDLLKAADMFSMANRMVQDFKYAQVWGNTMQAWLKAQKGSQDEIIEFLPEKTGPGEKKEVVEMTPEVLEEEPVSEAEIIKSMERNKQLLLKARELWPLEPALKFAQPPGMSPESESPADSPQTVDDLDLEDQENDLIKPMDLEVPLLEDDLIRQVPETPAEEK